MTAISLWQPWATLWLLRDPDEKVFETRHWYTQYRGDLLVHAAKKRDGEVREYLGCRHFIDRLALHELTPGDLAFGAIIGCVSLIGCCRTETVGRVGDVELNAGNWEPGRFAWERGPHVTRFREPIPYRGSQGFFDVPRDVVEAQL